MGSLARRAGTRVQISCKDLTATAPDSRPATTVIGQKKLPYLEAREYATLEQRIAEAEDRLKAARAAYEDPAIASNAERLLSAQTDLHDAQQSVDQLYARWAELETKIS